MLHLIYLRPRQSVTQAIRSIVCDFLVEGALIMVWAFVTGPGDPVMFGWEESRALT
jgi:hypothetical protein